MVGSPYQTTDNLADDILYVYDYEPEIIEIRPFIPEKDTVFQDSKVCNIDITLRIIAIMRILLPNALISSPLGLFKNTREDAILYGANVIMYNICNHSNIIKQNKKKQPESLQQLKNHINNIGYNLV